MSANSHQKKLKTLVIIPQRKLPKLNPKIKKLQKLDPKVKKILKFRLQAKNLKRKTQEIESQNNNPAKTKLPWNLLLDSSALRGR